MTSRAHEAERRLLLKGKTRGSLLLETGSDDFARVDALS